MSQPAVIFGGPSPEHDISVLTGLQAARALLAAGTGVDAIYWSKTNEWFAVDPQLEARDYAEGVPRKARPLVLGSHGFEGKRAPQASGTTSRRPPQSLATTGLPQACASTAAMPNISRVRVGITKTSARL